VHLTETHLPFHSLYGRLWNRASHYIFVLWFLLSSSSFLSPVLSGRKLDVYHTSTHNNNNNNNNAHICIAQNKNPQMPHDVALVRTWNAGLKSAACGLLKILDAKIAKN